MTRVLIVDDNEANLYYLQALLTGHGYEVEAARHGAEALVHARQAPPQVVISDLLMPVMDGYTLLSHWKADPRLREIPFIVYTATYTDPQDERLARGLGADAFILKPAEPEAFLARLRAVEAGERAARPAAALEPSGEPSEEVSGEPTGAPTGGLLREYNETLIRKLEARSLQLEASNHALQLAEQQASERAAVLDALFASVPDLVTHVDLAGRICLVNRGPSAAAPGWVVGASWLAVVPEEQRTLMQGAFDAVVATSQPSSFESSVTDPKNAVVAYWNTIGPVVRDGKLIGAVLVARDITERKQTDARLLVSDRMVSVGTLAAGVAHEINNPLASVIANLALMHEQLDELGSGTPAPGELLEELRDARDSAERVRLIVRDLKIFSRGDDDLRGPVAVEHVLDSTLRMAWNEVRHRARVTKLYGNVPPVHANESRLGQVLLNLIVNAAQAIPEGDLERNEIRVETAVDAAQRRVVISISDTGVGMSLAVQRRLFSPFFTTKPIGIGTGLGLSICHRIVASLGGAIEFTSEPGRGTTFRVALPMADLAGAHPAVPAARPGGARRGRVLVIDDDVIVTHAIRRLLAVEHEVSVVNCAADALARFSAGEQFEVVLCDLMMPQITGMDLYAALLQRDPAQAARVVFMTGGAFTASSRAFLDGVANPRIDKPFEVKGLRALVNRLVEEANPP